MEKQDHLRLKDTRKVLKALQFKHHCRDFSKTEPGDFVYCDGRIGKVCEIRRESVLPIIVDFGFTRNAFTRDGRMDVREGAPQALFKCKTYVLGLGMQLNTR